MRREVLDEPIGRQIGHRIQRSRLLEEMRGAGHHRKLHRASHPRRRTLVEGKHRLILTANDEQCGRQDAPERLARQIGTAAARYDRSDLVRTRGGCDQGRTSARTRAEQADREMRGFVAATGPIDDRDQARREQLQIEAVLGRTERRSPPPRA